MVNSQEKWIEIGFNHFAFFGPDSIQVEKLARLLKVNKSGFYHHFGDRDVFISFILDYHLKLSDRFCMEANGAEKFDPDYIRLLVRDKHLLFMQMQLHRNYYVPRYREIYNKVSAKTAEVLGPLLANHFEVPGRTDLAMKIWDIIRNDFFINLTDDELTYEHVSDFVKNFVELSGEYCRVRLKEKGFIISPKK